MNQKAGLVCDGERVTDLPMFAISPVLHNYPFVGFHCSVDTHAVFRSEPINSLSLGLSKMLKGCNFKYISDPETTSYAVQYQLGEQKAFFGTR